MILFSTKGNIVDTENTEQNQSNINKQTKTIRGVSAAKTDFDLAVFNHNDFQ
jgi:hypothetical protein